MLHDGRLLLEDEVGASDELFLQLEDPLRILIVFISPFLVSVGKTLYQLRERSFDFVDFLVFLSQVFDDGYLVSGSL